MFGAGGGGGGGAGSAEALPGNPINTAAAAAGAATKHFTKPSGTLRDTMLTLKVRRKPRSALPGGRNFGRMPS
ncbi:hypothetical protein BH10ACT9_BH10ACT9_50830 [soil metagenome]